VLYAYTTELVVTFMFVRVLSEAKEIVGGILVRFGYVRSSAPLCRYNTVAQQYD
jgi:hypothetical protein